MKRGCSERQNAQLPNGRRSGGCVTSNQSPGFFLRFGPPFKAPGGLCAIWKLKQGRPLATVREELVNRPDTLMWIRLGLIQSETIGCVPGAHRAPLTGALFFRQRQ
jgi:hypothetical protein